MCLFLAGISWKDKVADLRLKMAERNVVWFVVTALDEIACECSGFTVGACYPVSQLVLWESVCSQNSVFCMVSKQKTITSGYMACQVGWRRDYFGWRITGVGEEIVVGLEQCYSQALMPDLWWCPSLASLLRTVTPPSRGAFSKLFVSVNIRLSLKVWK